MEVRRSILPWICSFLSDRKQRVKLGESVSEWATVNAGVPQGTKLGPILFLVMVNDLIPPTCNHWKYVDDVTISEVISRHASSSMQSDLDYISSWASANYMMLNPKKCKELRICFFRETPTVFPLIIDGKPVDIVDSHKVLGIEINSSLKWSEQVDKITKKAAKRLYIIRVLRRSGLSSDELISIYTALIRSILEYCCAVWHNSLPSYLSEKIERLQKRALRIIFPHFTYREALSAINYPKLDDNRQRLCSKVFKKMQTRSDCKLASLVPKTRFSVHGQQLRSSNKLSLFKCNTDRFKCSFFPALTQYINNLSKSFRSFIL